MRRVFLDANILFSAAWHEHNQIVPLWDITDIQLVSSDYAIAEAVRNIGRKRPDAADRLSRLLERVEASSATTALSDTHGLPDKDVPIFASAIAAQCDVLVTGDKQHFGSMAGIEIEGVKIITARMLLNPDV